MQSATDPEDREQQADVTRLLLYYLNAPVAGYCYLRGVLPAPGAVRIAVRAGDDEHSALTGRRDMGNLRMLPLRANESDLPPGSVGAGAPPMRGAGTARSLCVPQSVRA
ncbi:hypothetical protein [Streptomyces sp. Tue6028]|uniref:hypothetical protein n=1 Tax=Streptomyces sp. Tue6028 TaxID=2036037 RepID=UPI003D739FCA